jgi:hypothetical protein
VTSDGRKEDLNNVTICCEYSEHDVPYLHERLRVVACPLFEVATSRETTQAGIGRDSGNPILAVRVPEADIRAEVVPAIDVVHYLLTLFLAVLRKDVVFDPFDQVILECAFDNLVEEVWRDEFMNVGPRKAVCEWLPRCNQKYFGHTGSRKDLLRPRR